MNSTFFFFLLNCWSSAVAFEKLITYSHPVVTYNTVGNAALSLDKGDSFPVYKKPFEINGINKHLEQYKEPGEDTNRIDGASFKKNPGFHASIKKISKR